MSDEKTLPCGCAGAEAGPTPMVEISGTTLSPEEVVRLLGTATDAPDDGTSILQEAQRVVFGARQGVYGHPRDDFAKIALLWTSYCDAKTQGSSPRLGRIVVPFTPQDVAYMMILLKMARLMESPDHRDSIVDIAGYAETAARVVGLDK